MFCDPKLPYADSARKWAESKRRQVPSPKHESGDSSHEDEDGDKLSVRRSKRTWRADEERRDDDDDECKMESSSALSELETLARSVRGEQETKANESLPLPSVHWFKDTTLEARLHHVVHAVQNNEWPLLTRPASSEGTDKVRESPGPVHSSQASQPKRRKLHIAIDVETERAKLHALLSTPPPHTAHPQSESGHLYM